MESSNCLARTILRRALTLSAAASAISENVIDRSSPPTM
jgi:hypothetical protein